jgi:fused signal recognition particle receptor
LKENTKLTAGLGRTRSGFFGRIRAIISRARFEADEIEELEALLLGADVGPSATEKLISAVTDAKTDMSPFETAKEAVFRVMAAPPRTSPTTGEKPRVWLFLGVNGTGKTTTIAKLARRFKNEGMNVLLCACDTYRAAGSEQLEVWARRIGVEIVTSQRGADAAAVAFDGVEAAKSRGADLLLIDTAGRLHTRGDLMGELSKIRRTLQKKIPDAPHETILVMDATLGQNGLEQAKVFNEKMSLTGIALCKIDGTAKGGIVIAVADELGVPVRYLGVGEDMDDLLDFNAREFAEALLAG